MSAETPVDQPLALLRDDLEISRGTPFLSGAPGWVIRDPVRYRFFQIGQRTIDVLSRWSAGTVERLKSRLFQEKGVHLSDEELDALIRFLAQNELLEGGGGGTASRFADAAERRARFDLWPRVQKLLFFRIPLLRPESFLYATWPLVRPLFSRGFVWISLFSLIVGLYLASRQTAEIEAYLSNAFTWSGAAMFLAAIAVIKVLHEFGHAFQAIRYGLRVPVMGIAFFVFLPLLYTNITDAWRLRRRADRVIIDLGGIFVELTIAIYATLLWCFLPDGPMRTVAFVMATSSWVISLLVNLNPFMRFDGYYLLSDSFGIQNLQNRAFALGRWAMRLALFGLDDPVPENLDARTRHWMIAYAYGVWVYRFFLFISISLLVYAMFFKLAGAVMLLVSITGFVVKPVLAELRYWVQARDRIRRSARSLVTLMVILSAVTVFFWPMSTRVHVPALLEEARQQVVFPPEAARLEKVFVAEGDRVTPGAPLFEFSVPDLPIRIAQAETRIEMHKARQLSAAGDAVERAEGLVIARVLDEEAENLAALQDRQTRLVVRATTGGIMRELSTDLDVGTWYARTHWLGRIIDPGALTVRGFVNETDLHRADLSKIGKFVADEVTVPTLELGAFAVSDVAIERLPDGYLARPNGGSIAVSGSAPGELIVAGVWYPLTAAPQVEGQLDWLADDRILRGVVLLRSQRESYAKRIGNRVARVLFRELSF